MSAVPSDLPELVYDSLSVGQRFQDSFVDVTPDLVRSYAAVLKNPALAAQADAPSGTPLDDPAFLLVFGVLRRVLANDGRAPQGGILAGQDHEYYRPLKLGERVRTETSIGDKYERRGRRYIALRCDIFGADGEPIGRVDSHVIWAR